MKQDLTDAIVIEGFERLGSALAKAAEARGFAQIIGRWQNRGEMMKNKQVRPDKERDFVILCGGLETRPCHDHIGADMMAAGPSADFQVHFRGLTGKEERKTVITVFGPTDANDRRAAQELFLGLGNGDFGYCRHEVI